MKKPALVIMAAGMGSRYGGLKQIDPLDDHGQIIMDFSIYDALRAGFGKIVFIIKKEIEEDFKKSVGDRISKVADVAYVYQELDKLPKTEDNRYSVPEGRTKPWGTGHAVLCCKGVLDEPFAVINADDYYGPEAFRIIAHELTSGENEDTLDYCMVGYILSNTLTENGTVSRGICDVDENGFLKDIEEKTKIAKSADGAQYSEDNCETWRKISPDSIVSMNMWGFKVNFLNELEKSFVRFLDNDVDKNPMKSEFFLPKAVEELLEAGKATVKVLKSTDRWFGVTYKEDKADVVKAIRRLKDEGFYPDDLWQKS
ncbi:MAG: nucleotidyltransferase [Lachnospiraceae bacterium]|nr:nucleotidyltransferase [Lachnospiraceae bacterium]